MDLCREQTVVKPAAAHSGRSDNLTDAGRLLRLPLHLVPPWAQVRVLSGPLRGARWIAGSSVSASWLGTYERAKVRELKTRLRPGDVVYDLGAHVGLYTLLAARAVGPAGQVYAFEPLPRNLHYLYRHLELNGVRNCTVLPVAISDHQGLCAFNLGAHPAMGHLSENAMEPVTVPTYSIDALLSRAELTPPGIVKCDIEGDETRALNGALQTLTEFHPIVFLATHGADPHAQCCALLEELGYQLSSLTGAPVRETSEILAIPRYAS